MPRKSNTGNEPSLGSSQIPALADRASDFGSVTDVVMKRNDNDRLAVVGEPGVADDIRDIGTNLGMDVVEEGQQGKQEGIIFERTDERESGGFFSGSGFDPLSSLNILRSESTGRMVPDPVGPVDGSPTSRNTNNGRFAGAQFEKPDIYRDPMDGQFESAKRPDTAGFGEIDFPDSPGDIMPDYGTDR